MFSRVSTLTVVVLVVALAAVIPAAVGDECRMDWVGDGVCDQENNHDDCAFDGGDCCPHTCEHPDPEEECGTKAPFECKDPCAGDKEPEVTLTDETKAFVADDDKNKTEIKPEVDDDGTSALTYKWEVVSKPDDSKLKLADLKDNNDATKGVTNTTKEAVFTPDVAGVYCFALTVNDKCNEGYDEVCYNFECNDCPNANAGDDVKKDKTETIILDASKSTDAEDEDLKYKWTILDKPCESKVNDTTAFTNQGEEKTIFEPDVAGQYFIEVEVCDHCTCDKDYVEVRVDDKKKEEADKKKEEEEDKDKKTNNLLDRQFHADASPSYYPKSQRERAAHNAAQQSAVQSGLSPEAYNVIVGASVAVGGVLVAALIAVAYVSQRDRRQQSVVDTAAKDTLNVVL
eukprot:GFYU01009102.1.p1 GENE.GFYU01009102.1~~GFYU01009102.1.p1  ORF type:complete len:400 (+),score=172.66 GFYU01009102.1:137-1336(+)